MGDADYLAVFHHILLPIAYEVSCLHLSFNSVQTKQNPAVLACVNK